MEEILILSNHLEIVSYIEYQPIIIEQLIKAHYYIDTWSDWHCLEVWKILESQKKICFGFALKNKAFQSLKDCDQELLLKKNVHLFRNYILARYVTGRTGVDQLTSILGPKLPNIGNSIFCFVFKLT